MIDPSLLTTRSEILAQLASLEQHESQLDTKLANLISSRSKLSAQLNLLDGLREVINGIQLEAGHMSSEVGRVAETAERVGGKVRILDEEQSRVKESIEVVQAVQDLKTSIASLDVAMQKEDWEAATRCMQRASAIDASVVASGFAEAVVPTANLPLPPPQTLSTLRATLLDTFLSSFRLASTSGDVANTNRFFKLFPMIREEEVGLEVYAEWVSGIVRSKTEALSARSQSVTHFSSLLTTLFESIALIISQHQPVVEKNYGLGKMTAVAQTLMSECDSLGLQVLKNWEEERKIRRKLNECREYKFVGLGLIVLGSGRAPLKVGRGGERDSPIGAMGEEEKIDPREVDALLAELSMMSGRWELLRRFLYGRLKDTDEEDLPTPIVKITEEDDDTPPVPPTPSTKPKSMSNDLIVDGADLAMVEKSELGSTISRQLKTAFEPMEIWYLRSSIEKAHQMDELDLISSPSLSSSLDDTFYILKKTLYRLISTASLPTLLSMTKELKMIIEKDVAEIWRARMDSAFKEVGSGGGVGRAREEEKDRREKEARATFIVYLNNLDVAAEYAVRLIDEIIAGEALHQSFFLEAELERARIAILGVRSVEDRFRGVLKSGLDHLFNQLLRPRLRPLLSDVYKDISYVLTEEGYSEAEYRDDVRKRFIKSWEAMLAGYRESFTPSNYNLFFATAVNVLVRPWEGMIRGMKFTELGALRLDRDIRSILSYLCSQSSFASGSIRESFSRLQQIATLLTLDSEDEANEVLSSTGNRLTASEVTSIMALRL